MTAESPAQPAIRCEPVEQSWWSEVCTSCDHSLLTHKKRTIMVQPDGSEFELPVGEALEIPEGVEKIEISECTTCNLLAAVGGLHNAIGNLSTIMNTFGDRLKNQDERMDQAGLPELTTIEGETE